MSQRTAWQRSKVPKSKKLRRIFTFLSRTRCISMRERLQNQNTLSSRTMSASTSRGSRRCG